MLGGPMTQSQRSSSAAERSGVNWKLMNPWSVNNFEAGDSGSPRAVSVTKFTSIDLRVDGWYV
jgi:hypothetical protein